jgi:putative membrane protein
MIRRIGIAITLMVVTLLITIGVPSLAQQPPTPAPTQAPRVQTQRQLSEVDKEFMLMANQNAVAAIALGQLALEKATQAEVQQFAQAEIEEQVQIREALAQLAPRLGVNNLPAQPTPRDQEVQARMTQLSEQQFDTAFMNEVGINAHLKNAALYQGEAALGQNAQLVDLAARGIPLIDQHFNIASDLTGYRVAQVPPRIDGRRTSGTALPGRPAMPNTPSIPRSSTPQ